MLPVFDKESGVQKQQLFYANRATTDLRDITKTAALSVFYHLLRITSIQNYTSFIFVNYPQHHIYCIVLWSCRLVYL